MRELSNPAFIMAEAERSEFEVSPGSIVDERSYELSSETLSKASKQTNHQNLETKATNFLGYLAIR